MKANRKICREEMPTQADMVNACRNIGCFIVARSLNSGDYLLRLGNDTVCNLYFNAAISRYDDDFDDEDGIDFNIHSDDETSGNGGIGFRDRNYDDDDDDDDEYDYDDEEEDFNFYYTKSDYLNAICAIMGGYIAEEVVLKKLYNNTYYLLTTVDCILLGMSRDGLMGLELRYTSGRNDDIEYTREKLNKVNDEFDKIIDDCYKRAKQIIEANAELIRKLMPILVDKGNIFKPECEKILNQLGGNKNPIIKNRYFPLFFTYKSTLNAAFLYIKDILAPESIIRGHRFGHCPDCRNDVTRSRLRRTIAVPSLRSLQVRPVAPKKRTPLRVFSFLAEL